jgi:hypothetical protein
MSLRRVAFRAVDRCSWEFPPFSNAFGRREHPPGIAWVSTLAQKRDGVNATLTGMWIGVVDLIVGLPAATLARKAFWTTGLLFREVQQSLLETRIDLEDLAPSVRRPATVTTPQ